MFPTDLHVGRNLDAVWTKEQITIDQKERAREREREREIKNYDLPNVDQADDEEEKLVSMWVWISDWGTSAEISVFILIFRDRLECSRPF
jgi:hypothetical protein